MIGHQGVFLASLDHWAPERAGKTRPLQSGYRAWWSLGLADGQPLIQQGPIDLVDARSIVPGNTGQVVMHPMIPEGWAGVGAGDRVPLLAHTRDLHQLGEAVIVERRDVPASVPLNLEPFDETHARRSLRSELRYAPTSSATDVAVAG